MPAAWEIIIVVLWLAVLALTLMVLGACGRSRRLWTEQRPMREGSPRCIRAPGWGRDSPFHGT